MLKNAKIIFLTLLFTCAEILNAEIFFLFISVCLFIIIVKNMKMVSSRMSQMLGIIVIIGLIGGMYGMISNNYNLIDILRDIYITITPIIYVLFGISLYNYTSLSKIDLFKAIIFSGFILSIRHLILILLSAGTSIRGVGGNESFTTLIAIIILLFYKEKNELLKNKLFRNILLIVMIISFILYLSRSCIGALGVTLFTFIICNRNTVNKIKTFIKILLSVSLILSIIYYVIPSNARKKFTNKLYRSFSEISANSNKVWDIYTINSDWRGYEVYRTKQVYSEGNLYNNIFGFGFGKLLPLNLNINLSGGDYTEIATLHNGYYYLLLKTGIIGVLLYLLYFVIAYIKCIKMSRTHYDYFEIKLLAGIYGIILFNTYVIRGIYNYYEAYIFCVIIGFISMYISSINAKKLSIK